MDGGTGIVAGMVLNSPAEVSIDGVADQRLGLDLRTEGAEDTLSERRNDRPCADGGACYRTHARRPRASPD